MMRTQLARVTGAMLLSVVLAGCETSTPTSFYTLDSTAKRRPAEPVDFGVMVGPVSVPASVDRPEFVVQITPNRVEIDEFHRWAAPLGESIARTVAGDLSVLLGTPDVAVAPFANFDPAYRVTINVQRFDSTLGDSVRLEAVWALRRTADGQMRGGRTASLEAVAGKDFDALAAAHSRAISQLSGDIAAAVREAAATP
jgi:uncharacterized lipoprotein YmbA